MSAELPEISETGQEAPVAPTSPTAGKVDQHAAAVASRVDSVCSTVAPRTDSYCSGDFRIAPASCFDTIYARFDKNPNISRQEPAANLLPPASTPSLPEVAVTSDGSELQGTGSSSKPIPVKAPEEEEEASSQAGRDKGQVDEIAAMEANFTETCKTPATLSHHQPGGSSVGSQDSFVRQDSKTARARPAARRGAAGKLSQSGFSMGSSTNAQVQANRSSTSSQDVDAADSTGRGAPPAPDVVPLLIKSTPSNKSAQSDIQSSSMGPTESPRDELQSTLPSARVGSRTESRTDQNPKPTATPLRPLVFVPPCARENCGRARYAFRRKFNMREIEACLLLNRYDDADGRSNEGLDYDTLKSFLKAFIVNGGLQNRLRTEDLDFIMVLLAKDSEVYDLGIHFNEEEILQALRSWYCWKFMPLQEVQAAVAKEIPNSLTSGAPVSNTDEATCNGDMQMPSVEVLGRVLRDLNGFDPVCLEDAEFVINLLRWFGGTDERVSLYQFSKAIAVWYMNVERSRTGVATIVFYSCWSLISYLGYHGKRAWKHIPMISQLRAPLQQALLPPDRYDELVPDPMARDETRETSDLEFFRPGKVMPYAAVGVGTGPRVPPSRVATASTSSTACYSSEEEDRDDEPQLVHTQEIWGGADMATILIHYMMPIVFWGLLSIWPGLWLLHVGITNPEKRECSTHLSMMMELKGILVTLVGICGIIFNISEDYTVRQTCAGAGMIVFALCVIEEVYGFVMVQKSSPSKCGGYIWQESDLFFVWLWLWLPGSCCLSGLCSLGCVAGAATHSRMNVDARMSVPDSDVEEIA